MRKALSATAVLLATSILCACATDRATSPMAPIVATGTRPANANATIANAIAIVRARLDATGKTLGLSKADAVRMNERRIKLTKLLDSLNAHLVPSASQREAIVGDGTGDAGTDLPVCFLYAGDLSDCFMTYEHHSHIDGTGNIMQVTSLAGSQSAQVSILLDGIPIQKTFGSIGYSAASQNLVDTYTFPTPNCNVSSHSVSSTATHTFSATIVAANGFSFSGNGQKTSTSPTESCAYKGLSVTITPSSISLQEQADMVVANLSECNFASVSASPADIVTVMDAGNNHILLSGIGEGTATVTVTCGTQRGTGTVTVKATRCEDPAATNYGELGACTYPVPPDNPNTGSGSGTDGCFTLYESYDGGYTWYIVGYTEQCFR